MASRRRLVLTPPSKPVSSRVNRYVSNMVNSICRSLMTKTALESPFYAKQTSCTYWEQCFENLQYLGQGSFAQVYKVRNKEDGQLYAIKRSKEKFRGVSDR
ncbi:unnamed protein product [Didymodactylos carnosus]|nr:unnamed protein product [Didymodactylos carnosus]CAF4350298.1 unnamed protein product [Didymodactylos carnosus]